MPLIFWLQLTNVGINPFPSTSLAWDLATPKLSKDDDEFSDSRLLDCWAHLHQTVWSVLLYLANRGVLQQNQWLVMPRTVRMLLRGIWLMAPYDCFSFPSDQMPKQTSVCCCWCTMTVKHYNPVQTMRKKVSSLNMTDGRWWWWHTALRFKLVSSFKVLQNISKSDQMDKNYISVLKS